MLLLEPYHFVVLLLLLVAAGRFLVASGSSGDDGRPFVYNGFTGVNLTLEGAAFMQNGLLRLTSGTGKGQAFHPSPLPFRTASNATGLVRSFSTTFVFTIFSQYDIDADLSSDSMGFFVSESKDVYLGFGYRGYTDTSHRFFAVEFAFEDERSDVGIYLNSSASDSSNAGYYADGTEIFRYLSLMSGKAVQVWVDYDGRATEITVTMAPLGMARPQRPLLQTTNINLSDVVQSTAYVGFSSARSDIFSTRQLILGWSFALDGPAPALDISVLTAMSMSLKIVLVIASVALVLVGMGVYIFVRRRLKYSEVHEDWEVPFGPHRFSYKDLFHATEGFSDKNLLGRGGFGSVYKGVLRKPDMEVAVKRMSHDSRQGVKEFIAEVVSIGRLRHRNLAQLLGYCRRKGELLLIYEYMENGSLDKYLHNIKGPVLDWPQRYWIIKGVASSLFYLHEKWEHVVIHRDIKPSNVLLDSQMNGRLGDFGLAKIYDHESAAPATHVAGTIGYLAPELARTGRPTPFTDVYAFGMFLLEVTCGRKPIFTDKQNNRLLLVEWVLEHHRDGSILDTVDPRLQGEFNMEEVTIVLKLGLICTYPLPNMRPIMRKVMQYLVHNQPPPDLSPAYISYMSLMQNQGFNSDNMNTTCSEATTSVATVSSATILRDGR